MGNKGSKSRSDLTAEPIEYIKKELPDARQEHRRSHSTPRTVTLRQRRRSEGLYPCLDPIVRLATEHADLSLAAVMMLDEEYGRVVSKSGSMPNGPRRSTFCLWCILSTDRDVMVIENTATHPTYWNHPVVTQFPNIRTYIGVPLMSLEGRIIGAFCVADVKTRVVTTELKDTVRMIGKIIESRYRSETALPPGDCLGLCDVGSPTWPIKVHDKRAKALLGDRLSGGLQKIVKSDLGLTGNSLDSVCLQMRCDFGLECTGLCLQTSSLETKHLVFFRFVYDPTLTSLSTVGGNTTRSNEIVSPCHKSFVPDVGLQIKDVEFRECLGKGSYGTVYEALWKDQRVAVKIVPTSEKIQEEISIGLQLSHQNVVKTIASEIHQTQSGKYCLIFMELCSCGSLYTTILQTGCLRSDMKTMLKVSLGTAEGLQHLHDRSILHGDLTGNNVLLTEDYVPKLSDFGLSRKFTGKTQETQMYGTLTYMPPELLKDGLISKAMDVYSLGVLMWEMVTGERAFADRRPSHIMSCKIFGSYHLEIPESVPYKLNRLISQCLADDYKARPAIRQVVLTLSDILSQT